VRRQRGGEAEAHEGQGEAAPPAEPLGDQIGRAQHQRALAEEAQRGEADGQRHQAADRAEADLGEAEQGCDREQHPAHAIPVDQPPEIGEAERGDQGREPVG
jgi:hypothetical protein